MKKTSEEIITKTVWQYSKPLPSETLAFLQGIAEDYGKVKNFVYGRYSGIRNMNRLVPAYDVLNEMRHCGLRAQLNLPAAYYELAVSEAVTDIRGMWGMLKNKLRDLINANENLSADDRAYLRTVLKINSVFSAILNRQEHELPSKVVGLEIDAKRLNNLLCRLVRKHLQQPKTNSQAGFKVIPAGYRYKEQGLYLVSRQPRKRICIPLRDSNTSSRQLHIVLKGDIAVIAMPVDVIARKSPDAHSIIYAYIGYKDMLTLSNGHVYGENLNKLVTPETERLYEKNRERRKQYAAYRKSKENGNLKKAEIILSNNLGKQKYFRIKQREREKTVNYINAELNRLLREEKPCHIVINKPITKGRGKLSYAAANRRMARSFSGYICEKLAYKCRLHGIELEQISPYGTASTCSECGAEGKREQYDFICENCGLKLPAALNTARNIEKLAGFKPSPMGKGDREAVDEVAT